MARVRLGRSVAFSVGSGAASGSGVGSGSAGAIHSRFSHARTLGAFGSNVSVVPFVRPTFPRFHRYSILYSYL